MGSSKKKHKKNKEKDRDRDRDKVRDKSKHNKTSSSSSTSLVAGSNVAYEATASAAATTSNVLSTPQYSVEQPSSGQWDEQQSTGHSTMLRPLRLVLKLPSSAYSFQHTAHTTSATTATTTTTAPTTTSTSPPNSESTGNTTELLAAPVQKSPPPNEVPNQTEPSSSSPASLTLPANGETSNEQSFNTSEFPIGSTDAAVVVDSNIPEHVFTGNESLFSEEIQSTTTSLQYINSLFSNTSSKLLSKKVKKSKKSKKSKHHKHSHSHKHSHKKHHHHHHHHTSTTLPVVDAPPPPPATTMNSLNLTLLDNSLFSAEKKASDLSTFTSDSNLPTVNNDSTSNMDTTITTATYFSDFDRPFVTTSTSTQQSLELNSLNEFSSKSNWHSTFKNTTLKTMVNSGESTAQNSYFLSSTDNDMLSQKTGSEIKLKLSKTSSSSQYTSNLHHSPGKLTQFTALPPTVPPLIISPLKASSLSVEKSTQITSSEVHQTNLSFQINSKVHNATSDTSNVVLENKLPGTEEPLQKRIKLNNNKHKNVKKKKSEKNFTDLLSYLLRQLTKRDAQQFFAKPVSDLIAPGYSAIIAHPMDLSTIGRNIASGHYHNLGDFKADVKLMCDNAMKYNRAETIYYKAASKLWSYTKNKLFKNASLAEYAKTYVKCTPLDLSLNPSSSQLSNSKYHSTSTHSTSVPFFSIASFNAESAAAAAAATAANNGMPGTSTNLLKSSPARFEPASMPVGFDGIAPMTSTTPFSLLEPEPSSNRPTVESQEKPEPSVSVIGKKYLFKTIFKTLTKLLDCFHFRTA